MVVDEAVVDLVGEMAVDELPDLVPVGCRRRQPPPGGSRREGVALGHEVLDEGEAFTGPDDGEGEEDAEQERGHAGHRHVHPNIPPSRPTTRATAVTTAPTVTASQRATSPPTTPRHAASGYPTSHGFSAE